MALDATKQAELAAALRDAGGLDQEQKSILLGLLNERKRYGLVWEDKPEDAYEKLRTELPVFTEVPERRIVGASPDSPDHILIEGDNLYALTALQYTHAGKVDVIYIDPPYNTGNKDFTYNDTFVDKEDTWRHSKWLSFMEKRLKLAKELLKETGVIFISIDDNEQAQLKLLCDEVLGEGNFVGCISAVMNLKGNPDTYGFVDTHEYLLVYTREQERCSFGTFLLDSDALEDWEEDEWGLFKRADTLRRTGQDAARTSRPKGWFPIFIRADGFIYVTEDDCPVNSEDAVLYPINEDGLELSWTWGKEKIRKEPHNLVIVNGRNGLNLYKKQRIQIGDSPTSKPKSLFYKPEYSTSTATKELKKILYDKPFSGPKPVPYLKDIIQIGAPNKSALILDFFAGSGTTLHATMALNAEDGGKRQCILVTNNENDICENVTYERNKRVIQGYTNAKGVAVPGLVDNTLRYYKTEFVPREPTLKNRREFVKRAVELIAIKENAFHVRTDLSGPSYTVIEAKHVFAFVVSDPDAVPDVVDCIHACGKPCRGYVFSPGNYAWDEDFAEVRHQVELIPMPEAVYAALENELPKRSLVSEVAQ